MLKGLDPRWEARLQRRRTRDRLAYQLGKRGITSCRVRYGRNVIERLEEAGYLPRSDYHDRRAVEEALNRMLDDL
jgi:hypothetical protein